MLKKGRYKYTFYNDGSSELYDLQNDPKELENLAQKAEYSEVCANMSKELLKWQIQTWPVQKPQQGLPYHYRATWIEAVPDTFKQARKQWDDMSASKQ